MTSAALPLDALATERVVCTHCGLPVPSGLVDEAAPRQFCCTGCRTAFAILHEHGLDGYYGLAERRETPVRASGRSFEEFDHAAFRDLYVRRTPDGLAQVDLYLEGVHCASCVWLVERVPMIVPATSQHQSSMSADRSGMKYWAISVAVPCKITPPASQIGCIPRGR